MLSTRYNHAEAEEKIYSLWETSGFFNPDNPQFENCKLKIENFSIIMPPPNANGALHIGHALFVTLQDIMTRFNRMRGRKTLWLPSTDHAGFETQVVFDKKLEREGRSRFQIDRNTLYEEMLAFTLENKKTVEHQLRKLGASCDWSRNKFTLDPDIVEQVQKTFIRLYEDGLIYRAERLVNWCVKHQTALSDLEVKHIEQKDPLYYMRYGPFTLATVRPETKFGDTAVAVHPKDQRYKQWVGQEVEVEGLVGKFKIKVIADEAVNPEFGTGVVKVTPAHDFNDFEIGLRHNLERRQVIDRYGKLNERAGPYAGLKIKEAREKVAENLRLRGLLEKIDDSYTHSVAVCYKCGNQLEPLLLPQWWIKMKPLAEPAIKTIESGEIKYYPDSFRKITLHWLRNIEDWNISRQIVWGIRIPAWFCAADRVPSRDTPCPPTTAINKPAKCESCGSGNLTQDPDVFDTWFSSGQWPYLTLGFKGGEPEPEDMKKFYPTDVMETAGDIIFFWVARMIMLGLYRTGKIPFRNVYLHGLVLDKDKKKMSKSKGNVIDPLGVASEYGMDAVRVALIAGNTPGRNTAISEDKIRGYRNFATKLWNIARFVLTSIPANANTMDADANTIAADKKILHFRDGRRENVRKSAGEDAQIPAHLAYSAYLERAAQIKESVTRSLEKFEFHLAFETIYHYIWHELADKILEEMKPRLRSKNKEDKAAAQAALVELLAESLKILHPFMPFITEEIYQHLLKATGRDNGKMKLLMVEEW